jgi:hypothetical protein
MKAKAVADAVSLAAKVSNPQSLTPLYRSIELGPDSIRACSEFGNIEIFQPIGGLAQPVLLDAATLDAVVSSVGDDIQFSREETKVMWKAGAARGHFMSVQQEHVIPDLGESPTANLQRELFNVPPEFADALDIASSACLPSGASVGLFGEELSVRDGKLCFIASNSIALSYAEIPAPPALDPKVKIVLRPPVPNLIGSVLAAAGEPRMEITKGRVFIVGQNLVAEFPGAAPLEHDLYKVINKFEAFQQIAAVSPAAVKKFLARARILSDKRASVKIGLRVEAGKLALEQKGLTSSSEEYFLAEGLDESLIYSSVALPLDMMLLPLANVDGLILDYLPQKTLIFCGEKCNFLYILAGAS